MAKYELPEELLKLVDKTMAFETLRDRYVKLPFGYRKAKKCAINHQHYKRKFWNSVSKLYPELENKALKFNIREGMTCDENGP